MRIKDILEILNKFSGDTEVFITVPEDELPREPNGEEDFKISYKFSVNLSQKKLWFEGVNENE